MGFFEGFEKQAAGRRDAYHTIRRKIVEPLVGREIDRRRQKKTAATGVDPIKTAATRKGRFGTLLDALLGRQMGKTRQAIDRHIRRARR